MKKHSSPLFQLPSFNCLLHDLSTAKLHAYGFDLKALRFAYISFSMKENKGLEFKMNKSLLEKYYLEALKLL